MKVDKPRIRRGLTLAELVVSISISVILVMAVGVLLDGGHRAWLRTYASAHSQIRQDARTITTTFGIIGRRSNRSSYVIYQIDDGTFTPAFANPGASDAVVGGSAVEFRYWDVELDTSDSHALVDPDKQATAYALFYLDGDQLKVDHGPYPPGAVPLGGGSRNETGVTTTVLAENVSVDPNIGAFSHTTAAGTGLGSVRLNLILTDPADGEVERVVAATLLRNIWPR